jgi:soluble lytic murein transglycosylase
MRRPFLLACLLALPAFAADAPRPETVQPSEAPRAQTPGAPAEAELAPPPETEKTSVSANLVTIPNPAFPAPPAPAPKVDRGPEFDASNFSPYFVTGNLPLAKLAYDEGQFTRAVELLEKEGDDAPVRYLRALALSRADQKPQAADLFEGLIADLPALTDRCLTHAAVLREDLGQLDRAAQLFAQVPSTSRLYPDARFGLARVLRAKGDLDGALTALGPLTAVPPQAFGRDVAADALMMAADLAKQKKDAGRERDTLLALWSGHPLSALAKMAELRLKGTPIPVDAKVARGEALIDANRNLPGLLLLKPLLPSLKLPDLLACRAHFAYGKGLRKLREHTRAEAELVPVVAKCSDPDLKPRALYVLGSSQSIVDLPKGVTTYEALAHDFPAHPFADDALFYAADLQVKLGKPDEARALLAKVAELYPNGDFAAEALFKEFWIDRRAGQLDPALAVLATIEKKYADAPETYEIERARYWRARVLEGQGKTTEAADLLEGLARAHPTTYYGLIASQRLAELDPKRPAIGTAAAIAEKAEAPWPLHAGTMAKDPHFRAGMELLRLGFLDAAPQELLAVDRQNRDPEAVRLLVYALSAAGDARSAHAIARVSLRRDLSGPVTANTRLFWEIAYPSAFRELVVKHGQAAGVDPDLIQGLMREESALDPHALSWAGALGLTQLMLPTAKSVAKSLKLKQRVDQDALFDPSFNLQLGSAYLSRLLQHFGGNPFYAIASYNAGPGAVAAWRDANPKLELDEWVEEIPVAETRGYVKRVLRSFNTYRLLYPGKIPSPGAGDLPVR